MRAKKKQQEECENAEKNPSCPYLTQINALTQSSAASTTAMTAATLHISRLGDDVAQVKKALVGDDMQGGLVATVRELKGKLETAASWANFAKPIGVAIVVAVIVGIISHYI